MKYRIKILFFSIIVTAAISTQAITNVPAADRLPSDKKELLKWYIDNYMIRTKLGMCDATIRNFRIIDSIPELDGKRKNMLFSMFIDMYLDREADSIKAQRFYDVVKPMLSCFPETDKKLASKVAFIANQTKNGDLLPFYPMLYRPDSSNVSLQDVLSDGYTYIDIWATTCGPCRKELPVLNELSAMYSEQSGKKIKFISLSIDDKFAKWQKFVAGEKSSCEQFFMEPADGARFLSHLRVFGVPRFILVGPDKRIVDKDAPRPTEIKDGNPILQNLK